MIRFYPHPLVPYARVNSRLRKQLQFKVGGQFSTVRSKSGNRVICKIFVQMRFTSNLYVLKTVLTYRRIL